MADLRVPVEADVDVVVARQQGRAVAQAIGMPTSLQTMVATAISEVARNMVVYAGKGEIRITEVTNGARRGIKVVARDSGPGIADPELAMRDGYSSAGSLGLGLPGARRLMDEFELVTTAGEGTTVTMCKWWAE